LLSRLRGFRFWPGNQVRSLHDDDTRRDNPDHIRAGLWATKKDHDEKHPRSGSPVAITRRSTVADYATIDY
jgi:hypothetical protein